MNFVTVEEADFHKAMIESCNFHMHVMHQAFLRGEISEDGADTPDFGIEGVDACLRVCKEHGMGGLSRPLHVVLALPAWMLHMYYIVIVMICQ